MKQHYTIQLRVHNEPAVLPRVLLCFSRRRLRIEAMQFFDVHPGQPSELQIDLDCTPEHAHDVLVQLRAVLEVTQVWAEPSLDGCAVEPIAARRAAA